MHLPPLILILQDSLDSNSDSDSFDDSSSSSLDEDTKRKVRRRPKKPLEKKMEDLTGMMRRLTINLANNKAQTRPIPHK